MIYRGVRRWMQPWRDELCVSLQNKRNVEKALNASKDEVFFLLDEGKKYSLNLAAFLNTLGRKMVFLLLNCHLSTELKECRLTKIWLPIFGIRFVIF